MTSSLRGTLVFADAHCVEAALDAFEAIYGLPIASQMTIDGLTIAIDRDDLPDETFSVGLSKMRALAGFARMGHIDGSTLPDREPTEHVAAAGRSTARDLPPAHHRWQAFFAVRRDDVSALQDLVASGGRMDGTYLGSWEYSLVHVAAVHGAARAIAVLADLGLPIDEPCTTGDTPLLLASTRATAEALIARGADVHRPSLIEHACAMAYEDVALLLLGRDDIVVETDEHGALAEACAYNGHVDAIRAMLARDERFATALRDPAAIDAAVEGGRSEMVDFLLQHGAVLPDHLLRDAIESGSLELVELALRDPRSIAECPDAMERAAFVASVEILATLERAGVPVHPETPGESSPIHIVASHRNTVKRRACLDWFLARGVPIDARLASGTTVLRGAAASASVDALLDLLDRGADLDDITELRVGAPMYAAVHRRLAARATAK